MDSWIPQIQSIQIVGYLVWIPSIRISGYPTIRISHLYCHLITGQSCQEFFKIFTTAKGIHAKSHGPRHDCYFSWNNKNSIKPFYDYELLMIYPLHRLKQIHKTKSKVYRPSVIDHSHECVNIYHVMLLNSTLSRMLQFNTSVISF